MKIKKGDKVRVIAGKDKGKTGTILITLKDTDQVILEGVNVATKHQKNKRSRSQGQIIEKLKTTAFCFELNSINRMVYNQLVCFHRRFYGASPKTDNIANNIFLIHEKKS